LRPHATCFVYDDCGNVAARYDKIHLFDVSLPGGRETYAESSFTSPGSATRVLATPWGRLGIAVCYDLRFPELFREMSREGLDFIALPAAFTVATGAAHWEVLLRARAVENLCYVIAAAQTGAHPGNRRTWGHSMIVDPWGTPLVVADGETGPVLARIDRERMAKLRAEFPALRHRRESGGSSHA
jgi:nitrilase